MIWFDLITPKSVMFFEPLIKKLQKQEDILITSRGDKNYNEINKLLENKNLKYHSFGGYAGKNLKDKLDMALDRQKQLNQFIQQFKITKLVNLCSVDGCRVAFGNGIEIINFCDFPMGKNNQITHVAKLTLPLSSKIFYPFYLDKTLFTKYCDNVKEYKFLDPLIYLKNQTIDNSFFENLKLNPNKKTILYREEEYKSSYVDIGRVSMKEVFNQLDVNLIIIPRYEVNLLKKEYPNAIILEEKIDLANILPFVDLFIGGGGTINIEATYFGIPVISTRSFISHYDKFLIDNGLMWHSNNTKEIINLAKNLIQKDTKQKSKEIYSKMEVDIDMFLKELIR